MNERKERATKLRELAMKLNQDADALDAEEQRSLSLFKNADLEPGTVVFYGTERHTVIRANIGGKTYAVFVDDNGWSGGSCEWDKRAGYCNSNSNRGADGPLYTKKPSC